MTNIIDHNLTAMSYRHEYGLRGCNIAGHRVSERFYREIEGSDIHELIHSYEHKLGRKFPPHVSLEEYYHRYFHSLPWIEPKPDKKKEVPKEKPKTTNKKLLLIKHRKNV